MSRYARPAAGHAVAEPRTAPRAAKVARTRQRLLGAAAAVFASRGYDEASIVEITQRAGMGLGSFYSYFPSKAELFDHLVASAAAELREHLRLAHEGSAGSKQAARTMLPAFLRWALAHPDLYRTARQGPRGPPEWFTALAAELTERLGPLMQEGILPRTDPEILAWSLLGMADLVASHWIASGTDLTVPTDRLDAFAQIAARAMGLGPCG